MKEKVGQVVPKTSGGYQTPRCKKCDHGLVIISPKTQDPMEHGLCRRCQSEELAPERAKKNSKNNLNCY
jgi:hypothetical protein